MKEFPIDYEWKENGDDIYFRKKLTVMCFSKKIDFFTMFWVYFAHLSALLNFRRHHATFWKNLHNSLQLYARIISRTYVRTIWKQCETLERALCISIYFKTQTIVFSIENEVFSGIYLYRWYDFIQGRLSKQILKIFFKNAGTASFLFEYLT